MGRDRSLDEFFDTEAKASTGDAGDEPSPADPGTGEAAGADGGAAVDPHAGERTDGDGAIGPPAGIGTGPAAITMAFVPGGAPCEACGASVQRRWRDGDALVCADCKEW